MSSNIRVTRICEMCKNPFVAKTTRTRFCSIKCNGASNKSIIKNLKIEKSSVDKLSYDDGINNFKNKDFLTVKEASKLLNISSKTIYRLIDDRKLNAINFSVRKTLIRRKDIDLCFEVNLKQIAEKGIVDKEVINFDNSYTIQEVEGKYNISSSALYNLLIRFSIPKGKQGKYTLVRKKDIDAIFN